MCKNETDLFSADDLVTDSACWLVKSARWKCDAPVLIACPNAANGLDAASSECGAPGLLLANIVTDIDDKGTDEPNGRDVRGRLCHETDVAMTLRSDQRSDFEEDYNWS